MPRPPRPCIAPRCPEYAEPGTDACAAHQSVARAYGGTKRSNGSTAAWRRARAKALQCAGHRCEVCGRTQEQARAAGSWLEVHHEDGGGVGAEAHDIDKLRVLCREPCHMRTIRNPGTKPGKRRRYRVVDGKIVR